MIDVSRETDARLRAFAELLIEENGRQNLISKSTIPDFWTRHVQDSLQLLPHAPPGRWVDIGSGAGLPGLIVAIAEPDREVVLIEPRQRRAEFLQRSAVSLDLQRVRVVASRLETAAPLDANVISARAVAALGTLFEMGVRHAAPGCRWLLPKGRSAAEELATARRSWQGRFTLIPSITDPEASIVMAEDVAPRRAR